ncbi:MAG: peptidylprolyl isomerase [Planctomycetota bacterium]
MRSAFLLALAAVACSGQKPRPAPLRSKPVPPPPVVTQAPQEARPISDYGPEVLLPDAQQGDAEVARIGDTVLRQSHAFARLLSAEPKLALSAVDLLVADVLVAQHAREFDIRVPNERVRELADLEEQRLREQVQQELAAQVTFEDYVWRIFGMRLQDWRKTAELRTAQRLYQGYVVRYLVLRENRVSVRYIVNKDEQALKEVAEKVRAGADFATLALRLSEDAMRRDGGLLPAFGESFPHPVTDVALSLKPGELSQVFERTVGGDRRYYLVYCLERLPGRDVTFASVQAEIDRELAERPLTPIETNAYTLRWRGAVEAKTDDKPPSPR